MDIAPDPISYPTAGSPAARRARPEEMKGFMERVMALEAALGADGAFVYGGALDGPAAATVVRPRGGDGVLTTDGPLVESKEQIGGFYIIEAGGLATGQDSPESVGADRPVPDSRPRRSRPRSRRCGIRASTP